MKRCPRCNFENTDASSYCERCGTFLSSNSNYTDPEEYQRTYRIPDEPPAPPPMYGYETPISGYQVQATEYATPQTFGYQPFTFAPPEMQRRRRSAWGIILSMLLFLWGTFWIAFGLAGYMLHDASPSTIGWVFLLTCLVGLIIMIVVSITRKRPSLRSGIRLLIAFSISIVAFIALVVANGGWVSILHYTETFTQYSLMGVIMVLYGLIMTLLANW